MSLAQSLPRLAEFDQPWREIEQSSPTQFGNVCEELAISGTVLAHVRKIWPKSGQSSQDDGRTRPSCAQIGQAFPKSAGRCAEATLRTCITPHLCEGKACKQNDELRRHLCTSVSGPACPRFRAKWHLGCCCPWCPSERAYNPLPASTDMRATHLRWLERGWIAPLFDVVGMVPAISVESSPCLSRLVKNPTTET